MTTISTVWYISAVIANSMVILCMAYVMLIISIYYMEKRVELYARHRRELEVFKRKWGR